MQRASGQAVQGRLRFALRAASFGLIVFLTGCGGQSTTEIPTLIPESPPAETSVVVTTPGAQVAGDTDSPSTGSPSTDLLLGALADRINAQWADLSRFREINTFTAGGANGIPPSAASASPASQRTGRSVREVILPDRARYLAEENGQLVFELVVIGDQVFARGTVALLLDATASANEWIVTDIATVAGNPMLGASAAGQFAELAPPSYVVPDRLRPQPVRDLGVSARDGTQCILYGAADTTDTGARIDFTVAVDPADRLCFVENRSIGISSQYVVEPLDPTATIDPPESFRPAASPVGTPIVNGTPVRAPSPVATP